MDLRIEVQQYNYKHLFFMNIISWLIQIVLLILIFTYQASHIVTYIIGSYII